MNNGRICTKKDPGRATAELGDKSSVCTETQGAILPYRISIAYPMGYMMYPIRIQVKVNHARYGGCSDNACEFILTAAACRSVARAPMTGTLVTLPNSLSEIACLRGSAAVVILGRGFRL